jgi:hypothetical protein
MKFAGIKQRQTFKNGAQSRPLNNKRQQSKTSLMMHQKKR